MCKATRWMAAGLLAFGLAVPMAGTAMAQDGSGAGGRAGQADRDEGFDDWGLLGLAGLAGLAGLMRRDRERHARGGLGTEHTVRT